MGLNDKYIILGTTLFSTVIRRLIENEGQGKVVAYSTSAELISDRIFDNLPVEPTEVVMDSGLLFINTIGYSKMNTIRQKVSMQFYKHNIPISSFISKRALIYTDEKLLGTESIIMPGAYIGPEVKLGRGNIVYSNVTLTHHIQIGDYNFVGAGVTMGGGIIIDDNCFFGLNSTVKNRINIRKYSLIGAGANILSSTEEYGIYIGNPARKADKKSFDTVI